MQNKIYLLMLSVFVALLSSCNQTKDTTDKTLSPNKYASQVTLKPDKSLIINIDTLTNFVSSYMDYYEDEANSKSLLVYLNNTNDQIQFYDLETKKIDFSINFDQKTGISQLKGFYIKSLDSVVVVSAERNMYFLINQKGEKLKTYTAEPWGAYLITFITNYAKVGMQADKWFVYHKLPYYPPNQKGFWKFPFTFSRNLDGNKIDTLYKYDGLRKDEIFCGGYLPFSCDQNIREQFVYSFFMDDYIYLTDFAQTQQSFYAGSKYSDEILSMDNIRNNEKLQDEQFNSSYSYKHIIYDKFRKVYYRFVLHPTNKDNLDFQHGKPISIIILDSKLQKIGETEIFTEKMYYNNFFVSSEGLYISLNHSENPEVDEDKLNFRLFKLVEKK